MWLSGFLKICRVVTSCKKSCAQSIVYFELDQSFPTNTQSSDSPMLLIDF